jgi:hypothetical protein
VLLYVEPPLSLATAVRADCADTISDFVLETFPSEPDGFSTSQAYRVLSRLSNSLSRLPYPSSQQQERLANHRRHTEKAPEILEDLSKLLRYIDDAQAEGKPSKKNKQRSKNPRPKAQTVSHAEVNDRLSQALGYRAPKSRDSAQEQVQSMLDEQKVILKVRRVTFNIVSWARAHPLVRNYFPSPGTLKVQS